ncbi:unnamed protein product [Musa acuminata var. zebrina]
MRFWGSEAELSPLSVLHFGSRHLGQIESIDFKLGGASTIYHLRSLCYGFHHPPTCTDSSDYQISSSPSTSLIIKIVSDRGVGSSIAGIYLVPISTEDHYP